MATDSLLWEPLALARWPGADARLHHDGYWHRLFVARAPMPHAYPLACDRIRTVTSVQQQRQAEQEVEERPAAGAQKAGVAAGSGGSAAPLPQLAFEEVMHQTFTVGLACSK
jgi:uncharacterized iron-regulated membrane protein